MCTPTAALVLWFSCWEWALLAGPVLTEQNLWTGRSAKALGHVKGPFINHPEGRGSLDGDNFTQGCSRSWGSDICASFHIPSAYLFPPSPPHPASLRSPTSQCILRASRWLSLPQTPHPLKIFGQPQPPLNLSLFRQSWLSFLSLTSSSLLPAMLCAPAPSHANKMNAVCLWFN